MHYAAKNGNATEVRRLLELGADPNATTKVLRELEPLGFEGMGARLVILYLVVIQATSSQGSSRTGTARIAQRRW